MHCYFLNWPHPFCTALAINHFKFTKRKRKTQKRRSEAICCCFKLNYSFAMPKSMRRANVLWALMRKALISRPWTVVTANNDVQLEKTRKKARVLDIDGRNFAKRNCKWIIEKKKRSYGWEESIFNVMSWRCALQNDSFSISSVGR